MLCANFICNNELQEYEIKKQSHKFNKWRLCTKCRHSRKRGITQIIIEVQPNFQKLYCKECMLKRIKISRRKTDKKNGVKRIRTNTTNYRIVEDILKSKKYVSVNSICDKLKIEPVRLFPYIQFLRKSKELNITTYYKLQCQN